MQIVIPMAGAGSRFAEAGYALPKPLIPIYGVPMVVRAARGLPKASRVVLVCNAEHIRDHALDEVLAQWLPNCRVVVTDGLTAGQAASVRLAMPELDPRQPVLVAACDNTHAYDRARFAAAAADPATDALLWTYTGESRVLVRPHYYGWVAADADGRVQRVGVKQTVSPSPERDEVLSGAFWFRSAELLTAAIDRLIAADRRVNGEFYLDSVAEMLVTEGCIVKTFRATKYIGWGTPDELDDYCRWRDYFAHAA